ncbi:MAG: hypothetical protein JRI25_20725 [Deltaproteobacteria bacterium]|nr:hypothetical protein [Deltaproteobacteria bacterium]MBW2256998.1 hypothetical protein [Deltaproteobacteria bacterium]
MTPTLLLTVAWMAVAHAVDPPAVLEIRAHSQAVAKAIAAGNAVTLEVDYNATRTPYPAVGNYGETLRFVRLWRFSEDEGQELDDRPAKIVHTSETAAMAWRGEYLFGSDGALRFAYVDDPRRGEFRFYFAQAENIRVIAGETVHDDTAAFSQAAGAVTSRAGELYALSATLLERHGKWEVFPD